MSSDIDIEYILKKELLRCFIKRKEIDEKTFSDLGSGYSSLLKKMIKDSVLKIKYKVYDETGFFIDVIKIGENYIDENTNVVFEEKEIVKFYSLN